MPLGIRATFNLGTTELFDYGFFFFPLRIHLDKPGRPGAGQPVLYYPRRGYDLWNTRYFILPGPSSGEIPLHGDAAFLPRSTLIGSATGDDDVRVLRNEAAYPRAWVVHRVRATPAERGGRASQRRALMREILYQDDELWHEPTLTVHDPHRVAWVEAERSEELAKLVSQADPDPAETVTVTVDDPQRVDLTALLRSPGLVVVSDVFYPGWTLTVDGRPAEILRTNRVMRGAALAAGTHRLVFRYEPASFRIGAAVSLAGLIAVAALAVFPGENRKPGG